jgi:hypothetical protein
MTKLGTTSSNRYFLSWFTQRFVNYMPEVSFARRSPSSIAKQIFNPISINMEKTAQELIEERDNVHPSVANIFLLDHLYRVNLYPNINFQYTTNSDNTNEYISPTVYATINNIEYEISQAENNDIESLAYTSIPSRIEDAETSYLYEDIIPNTIASDLINTTPGNMSLEGHLYITISNNTNWEYRIGNNIYYSKIYIRGITRKGTILTEVIPLRYNGTFKTINQWKSIDEVFVSYIDEEAILSISIFPWYSDGLLDKRNLVISEDGYEKWRFLNMRTHNWGQTFISEAYTTSDFDIIRKGIDSKDIEHEIELLDSNNNNITFDAFTMKPYTDLLFGISGSKFYVYNTKLPYPDITNSIDVNPDVKMDLLAEKWIFARDEYATIKTRILDFQEIPTRYQWHLLTPSNNEYNLNEDGTLSPFDSTAWIINPTSDKGEWLDKQIEFILSEKGTYIVSIDCEYINEDLNEATVITTKYLFYVPSITPEIELDIPETIPFVEDMSFDSDGNLWLLSNSSIYKLNVFYDYFIADYEKNILWFKEQYQSVRIVV